jgi:probable phosphoglycerate mutase
VTHGGPIRVAAASALGLPAGDEMVLDPPGNCSLTTLRLDGLTSYNVPTGMDR